MKERLRTLKEIEQELQKFVVNSIRLSPNLQPAAFKGKPLVEGLFDELRQEAIKQLKMNNDDFLMSFCKPFYFAGESVMRDHYAYLVKDWINYFFNIKDKKLKGGLRR